MWQIASATGWSVDYILNKVNYQTLIMMLSDAPRYVRDKSGSSGPADERSAEDEADGIVGFFSKQAKIDETGTNRIPYGGPFERPS
ncbi:hypothetical protein NXW99_16595 [Bacteroides faecis]|nr:hypothetical protein [Bacteroides faecis]UVS46951.1 hypothetical protein NXW99_16595 [Bacteroides faecis]